VSAGEWFHVTPAASLWTHLRVTGSQSVNTRRLPNPPTLLLRAHPLGALPKTERLGDFLEGVARCRIVSLTGAETQRGPASDRREEGDRGWRRPDRRESYRSPAWPGDGEPSEELELHDDEPDRPLDRKTDDGRSDGSAPIPLAAFLPLDSLAI
jgi:hypothetical protein